MSSVEKFLLKANGGSNIVLSDYIIAYEMKDTDVRDSRDELRIFFYEIFYELCKKQCNIV